MTGVLGVLGGMGPLASAAFLDTIYRVRDVTFEQEFPKVVMISDPTLPDRTEAVVSDRSWGLIDRLTRGLEALESLGATCTVITCMTSHAVLEYVPARQRKHLCSLVSLTFDALGGGRARTLFLSTLGSRRARVFEDDERHADLNGGLIYPTGPDAVRVHDAIYRVKLGGATEDLMQLSAELVESNDVDRVVFGCTEFHLLHQHGWLEEIGEAEVIDPLMHLAVNLTSYMD